MKKIFFILIAVVVNFHAYGQSKKELRNSESILWLGLDFTETRFEGKFDFVHGSIQLKDKVQSHLDYLWN
jgi:hypothetical protein